ncbi:MAG: adenylate/guanylate cyclase domain-containing protein [Spirochaetia bacterium]|nr:adenylate/guanylate cyclase domain-containing protein [Spirochaetota bacterium]MCX8096287.1 adenylate/guanylate cyclase domain-containing protein [Spirochaetota bacterium]MDW8113122.1 adenylate/guanylate cyclase domain-containing protein [Spirochaetia bacterium]
MDIMKGTNKSFRDVIALSSIAIASVIVSYFLSTGPLIAIKDTAFNFFFFLKGVETETVSEGIQKREFEGMNFVSDDIIIVGIDDKTLSKLGKFPFPRQYYYEYVIKPLLSITNNKYPNIVFFDIVFSEYSSKEEDKVFFEAISKSKGTLKLAFDYMFIFDELSGEGLPLKGEVNLPRVNSLNKYTIPKENIKGNKKSFVDIPSRGNLPVVEVIDNSYTIGYANLFKYNEYTETYNTVPMVLKYNDEYYPSILLVLLCSYYETSLSNVIVYGGEKIVIKNAKVKYPDGTYEIKDVFIPVDSNNYFFINYVTRSDKTSRNGLIKTISLVDIPRIRGLGNFVNGKILMIGMLAYGYGDIWKSPIADNMYGIEHLANAMNNIIMANIQGYPGYVKIVPETGWLIMFVSLVLSALVVIILVFSKRIISTVLLATGVIVGFWILSYYLFAQGKMLIFTSPISIYAYLTDVFTPTLSFILAFIGGQVFVISRERAQRMQIKGMLDSYVSPEVVNILLKNPEKLTLGGEDREVTIFFSDIRGFTALSEGLTPQELVSLINLYLSRMTDIIMDNRGTVDKYIGDAIMAFWGAPLDDPEHAYRACKSSLEMLKALEEINKNLPGDKKIDIGIGINTGIATIGNMGSTKKKNYTAMGDSVNLASRLEGVNKVFHTKIIISEYTFERVKDRILARELDLIRVKGKKLPVRIYEVIDFVDEYKNITQGLGLSLSQIQADV